jgi:hypothetical protein
MPNDKQGFVTGLLPPPVSFVAARRQDAGTASASEPVGVATRTGRSGSR